MESTRKVLTNSALSCFKCCRKKYFWSYVCGIRPEYDGKTLRMGSAYHEGLDLLRTTNDLDTALTAVRAEYEFCPENFDQREWEVERETVVALVNGYHWRWGDTLKVKASEMPFRIRLRNPATESPSTVFDLGGKIDGIVEMENCNIDAELESKTVSEDISFESGYWQRLQLDLQPTIYLIGARELGFNLHTVLWDATRKPTIKPSAVAVCDDLGAKIVLDAQGQRVRTEKGQWRQTGDTAKGYVLQQRDMTPEEWSKKLTSDIGERPEFYYQRREIPRLDSEIAECRAELWELQQTIRTAENENKWYRTVSFSTCPNCCYFGLCSSKYNPADPLPSGMILVTNVNPELQEKSNAPTTAAAEIAANESYW